MGRPLSDPARGDSPRGSAASTDQVVILGAGRAVRGSLPSAVADIDEHGRVLDWLLDAFSALGAVDVSFVGGYRAEEVLERYPDLRLVFNREWARTGPAHSLGLVPATTHGRVFVAYSDVIFRRSAVEQLDRAEGDVVLAVDSRWRDRYDGRSVVDLDRAEKVRLDGARVLDVGPQVPTELADAEYAGVLVLGPRGREAAFAAIDAGEVSERATMPDLVRHLHRGGLTVEVVDLEGRWAELDARQDLARFVLGTKAESLERLRGMQHGGEIGALVIADYADWTRATAPRSSIACGPRSPASASSCGAVLAARTRGPSRGRAATRACSTSGRTDAETSDAIDAVFASYGSPIDDDQVLIQEMLRDVAMSGVIMTRTHELGAPYYVFNFDDRTSRTDTVTGGGDVRTVVCFRDAELRPEVPSQLTSVLATVQDIEKLVGHDSLDIEFAVTADERVHVLQVRPIAVTDARAPVDDDAVASALGEARHLVEARRLPGLSTLGTSTRFSVMTDWNPAEIIGTKPRRLATSLYRTLVTDEVWARQRAEYGYRDVRPCPLLVEITGHPYVDVAASFTSFVPASLPDELARRLVDHALDRLTAEPSLHDKVEFEVLVTCLAPGFDVAADRLRRAGFAVGDIADLRDALGPITVAGMERLGSDLRALDSFGDHVRRIADAPIPPLDRAMHQIELARRGALTFAHLARGAFVATSQLRGLTTVGALTTDRVEEYLRSIETVFGRLQTDAERVRLGDLDWDTFVATYGHLRPGTYDITSPSYRSAPDTYLAPLVEAAAPVPGPKHHEWRPDERAEIAAALRGAGLPDDVDQLDRFMAGADRRSRARQVRLHRRVERGARRPDRVRRRARSGRRRPRPCGSPRSPCRSRRARRFVGVPSSTGVRGSRGPCRDPGGVAPEPGQLGRGSHVFRAAEHGAELRHPTRRASSDRRRVLGSTGRGRGQGSDDPECRSRIRLAARARYRRTAHDVRGCQLPHGGAGLRDRASGGDRDRRTPLRRAGPRRGRPPGLWEPHHHAGVLTVGSRRIGLTQRVEDHRERGERRDALDQRWAPLLARRGGSVSRFRTPSTTRPVSWTTSISDSWCSRVATICRRCRVRRTPRPSVTRPSGRSSPT